MDAKSLGWLWRSQWLTGSRGARSKSEITQAVLDLRGPTERLKHISGWQIFEYLDISRDTEEAFLASPLNPLLAGGLEFHTHWYF